MKELSGDLPVVFESNYERASRYYYLSGETAHSYNRASYRETEHDLLQIESELIGRKVFWINRSDNPSKYISYMTAFGKEVQYRIVEDFQSFREVKIELEKVEINENQLSGQLKLLNKTERTIDFDLSNGREVSLMAHYLKGKAELESLIMKPVKGQIRVNEEMEFPIEILLPEEHDKIYLRFSLKVQDLPAPINSFKYRFEYD